MNEFRLPIEKIESFISLDAYLLLVLAIISAWGIYKLVLPKISQKRHENLKERFSKITSYLIITAGLSLVHFLLIDSSWIGYYSLKAANYIGLLSFIIIILVIIKTVQVYVYLYLFWANMSQGVPRLIGNIFTLVFSTIFTSWIAAEVFSFNIATVLATSAIFTIVLGLALQDTLGNLFSGVALQMERPFNIGDWVEIHSGQDHWVGQIQEVTWRATSLAGFGEELIIIPNKLIAQSQLLVFNLQTRPARFGQEYKLKLNTDLEAAKEAIYEVLRMIPDVMDEPMPRVLLSSIQEQWMLINIYYSVRDYGTKNIVGDKVNTFVLDNFRRKNISLATPIITLQNNQEN